MGHRVARRRRRQAACGAWSSRRPTGAFHPRVRRWRAELPRQQAIDDAFDLRFGVDTAGEVQLSDAGMDGDAVKRGHGLCRPVWTEVFHEALRGALPVAFEAVHVRRLRVREGQGAPAGGRVPVRGDHRDRVRAVAPRGGGREPGPILEPVAALRSAAVDVRRRARLRAAGAAPRLLLLQPVRRRDARRRHRPAREVRREVRRGVLPHLSRTCGTPRSTFAPFARSAQNSGSGRGSAPPVPHLPPGRSMTGPGGQAWPFGKQCRTAWCRHLE